MKFNNELFFNSITQLIISIVGTLSYIVAIDY